MRAIEIIIVILAVIFVIAVIATSVNKRRKGGVCGGCCEDCPYHKKCNASANENSSNATSTGVCSDLNYADADCKSDNDGGASR